LQEQLISAGLVVGRDGDEHAQGVQDEHRVLVLLPGLIGIRERARGKAEERRAGVPLQPGISPEVQRPGEELLRSGGSFPLEAPGSSAYFRAA
jgi:hypothetical protein